MSREGQIDGFRQVIAELGEMAESLISTFESEGVNPPEFIQALADWAPQYPEEPAPWTAVLGALLIAPDEPDEILSMLTEAHVVAGLDQAGLDDYVVTKVADDMRKKSKQKLVEQFS